MITKCISNYEVLYLMLDKGRFKKIRSNVGLNREFPFL